MESGASFGYLGVATDSALFERVDLGGKQGHNFLERRQLSQLRRKDLGDTVVVETALDDLLRGWQLTHGVRQALHDLALDVARRPPSFAVALHSRNVTARRRDGKRFRRRGGRTFLRRSRGRRVVG